MEITDLKVRFHTEDGMVNAVNGVSYAMEPGEILGVVGESGCGKSVHALSIMRLIQIPPGKIESGEVIFDGRDLLQLSTPKCAMCAAGISPWFFRIRCLPSTRSIQLASRSWKR